MMDIRILNWIMKELDMNKPMDNLRIRMCSTILNRIIHELPGIEEMMVEIDSCFDIAPTRLNADGKYPCNHCQYQSTDQGNLKKHKLNIHEGVKYQCDQCQYQATQQGYLKAHKLSLHEGVKFDCDQCEYKATFATHLTQHKKVKHEGFRFPCDECDYKATRTTYLRSHKSKHHSLI